MSYNVADKYNLDMSGQTDNSAKLATMANDIATIFAAQKPMPRLVFPEGIVTFDRWPHLAYSGLQIVAEGQCILKHTGTGDAITFDGPTSYPGNQNGPSDLRFEGFTVQPSMNGGNGLIINSCHRSRFDVFVDVVEKPTALYSAISVIFCVLTEVRPRVSGHGGSIGLVIDALPGRPDLPATACRIVMPILENCQYGTYIKNGAYTNYYDGSIESCDIGIQIDQGGNNHFILVEMEGNATWDAVTADNAHDNMFWNCGEGHPSKFKSNFRGWNNRLIHGPLDGLFGL